MLDDDMLHALLHLLCLLIEIGVKIVVTYEQRCILAHECQYSMLEDV